MNLGTAIKAKVAYNKRFYAYLVVMLVSAAAWRHFEISWGKSYTLTTGVDNGKIFMVKNNVAVHEGQGLAKAGKQTY